MKKRNIWVKKWSSKREQFSHTKLLQELRMESSDWRNYLRMDQATYFELLALITPIIQRSDTITRKAHTSSNLLSVY